MLFFITSINIIYAETYIDPMSMYKENYFITGNKTDQTVWQVSAKYKLIHKVDLYAGYTQKSFWATSEDSSPFKESNYQPEVFFKLDEQNNIFDSDLGIIDYIQISPAYHCSNGRDGQESRGINLYYGQIQLSYGEVYNFGVNIKGFNYYSKSRRNKDIADYKGYYEADVFFKLRSKDVQYLDKEELHVKFGSSKDKGWICGEFQTRIISTYIQPKLFIQVWHGYGEFLIDYNKKETSVRGGIIF